MALQQPVALSKRCVCVLSSRLKIVCIVMFHGLAMMSTVLATNERPERLQELVQLVVVMGVPSTCVVAYAAVCPVDAPKGGVAYAVALILLWALLCAVNAAKWTSVGCPVESVVRPVVSLAAGTILIWLAFNMHQRKGQQMWPRLRLGVVLWNSFRLVGIVLVHALEAPVGYPPGLLSFENACAVNLTGLLAAALLTPTNRLRLAALTGGATVSWTLGELNAFEAATALGFEPAEVDEESSVSDRERSLSAPSVGRPVGEPAVGVPAVVVGQAMGPCWPRVAAAAASASPAPTRRTNTSWGSFGRSWEVTWEAEWQQEREKELEDDRRREVERELAADGLLATSQPDVSVPTLPRQLEWPTFGTSAAPAPSEDGAPAASPVWAPRARELLKSAGHALQVPRSSTSESRGSNSDRSRSESRFIVSTNFLRRCSASGLLPLPQRSGAAADEGLSGFGSTDGSTERGPMSSRSAISRVSTSHESIAIDQDWHHCKAARRLQRLRRGPSSCIF